jgi:ribosome-associated toxin RatA of RatAB toxin-antitoxin module
MESSPPQPSAWPALLRGAAPAPNCPASPPEHHDRDHPPANTHDKHHRPTYSAAPAPSCPSPTHQDPPPANAHDQQHPRRPTVETYSARRDERITVATPPDGFLFDLRLSARIPYPPSQVFDVLADAEAHRVFRGIRETVDRRVLSDDGRGKKALIVAHKAGLRILGITAAFTTRLRVDEDRRAGTIAFRGADADDASGGGGDAFMRKFEGSWRVAPFDERALRRAYGGGEDDDAGSNPLGSLIGRLGLGGWPGGGFGGGGGGKGAGASSSSGETLVTLEQALAPRLTPPKPVQPLVRALCGRTLQHMVEDLKAELGRRERAPRRHGGQEVAAAAAGDRGVGGGEEEQRGGRRRGHKASTS